MTDKYLFDDHSRPPAGGLNPHRNKYLSLVKDFMKNFPEIYIREIDSALK